jgi:riboflavin kinase / FMN adenylyltransferase
MRTVNRITDIVGPGGETPSLALTLGNFDGVHRGHQTLLRSLKDTTRPKGLALGAITFSPHPRKILNPGAAGFLICSEDQRRRWLAEAGVDWLVEIPFTRDLSTLSADEFLARYIFTYTNLKEIHLGWDFAFGAHKSAGATEVKAACSARAIRVEICPRYTVGASHVSSTRIRESLSQGDVRSVKELLGRPFSLEGLVVKGEGRGRRLGVPTANMKLDPDLLLPARGVYVSECSSRGMLYRSVTNVGFNPTFKDSQVPVVETHILDFDGDIYGEVIEVHFLERLRDERKFLSVDALVEQIRTDVESSRAYPRG